MGLHKLTAGDGYTYLTRQVAAHDATDKGHTSLGNYYSQKGESPGQWIGTGLAALNMQVGSEVTAEQMKALFGDGRHPDAVVLELAAIESGATAAQAVKAGSLGRTFPVFTGANAFQTELARRFTAFNREHARPWNAAVPLEDRARIRTDVGTALFTEEFGRPPADPRELTGFIARASRQHITAVAGYDLTFSPVKSVSALWAIAPKHIADAIKAAHDAAVADTVRWLETTAAYTRVGRAGVRQVEVNGLIAAAFVHRDARSGDPDLHTHVAVSNKVQGRDGRWLALDGRVFYKAKVSASERYNTRLESELGQRIGARFSERPDGDTGKRPVREILGVDPRLNTFWSSRRTEINTRRAVLAARFQAEHHRPPTEIEAIALAQQATLETRSDKHAPRSVSEQRATWRAQATTVMGSPRAVARMVAGVTGRPYNADTSLANAVVEGMAQKVVAIVESNRATWQVWHLRAEVERQIRAHNTPLSDVDVVVESVVARALEVSIPLGADDPISEPDTLRRSDGTSMYAVAGSKLFTSASVVAAEQSLLAAARRRDGRIVSDMAVGVALTESAANGLALNPSQTQLVTELATSGARVQVAIAPAGSGKTTAMQVLAHAWSEGGGRVIGLAPSARAAAELRRSLDAPASENHCDTLAKLSYSLTSGFVPQWVRQIGPETLVIIDEAGMAGTVEMARAVDYVVSRGASVRLVGDDQQLAAIAAGGILRDIADQVGVVTLSELQRFNDRAEGAATLALRLGDPAALGFYLDNGRIHVGDDTGVTDAAYQAWSADRAQGIDAVMLAPTRDLVSALNTRARSDRLTTSELPRGHEAALSDGNLASAGELIITRKNDRRLPISPTDWVKNGDRWRVHTVGRDGALVAVHVDTERKITLPAAYVRENVELGYALTVHGAQGLTADASHLIATGAESRQVFYVAMTRGRKANHVYLAVTGNGDEHNIVTPEALLPPTPTDILTAVLNRDQAQQSAASASRELGDPVVVLKGSVDRYCDAINVAAEEVAGAASLALLDAAADLLIPGLSESPAYPTLRAHLALLSCDGLDAVAALTRAIESREIGSALDPAAVLDWRLSPTRDGSDQGGPLPWLPTMPRSLADHPVWGPYLSARAAQVADLAGKVRTAAESLTPTTTPTWAARLLDADHANLRGDLAVWRAAFGIPGHDRRPAGDPQLAAAAERYQAELRARAEQVLGDSTRGARVWDELVRTINPRIAADPYWPEVADRLAAVERAGIDVRSLLRAAGADHDFPDDHPASALWWRLSRHLSPAATAASAGSGASTLRPPWTTVLVDRLGQHRASLVLADPAWPALVAAVNAAPRSEWTPEDLIKLAIDFNGAQRPIREGPADSELATALVWRVAMLTDPTPLDHETAPPDPYELEFQPPHDLEALLPLLDADLRAADADIALPSFVTKQSEDAGQRPENGSHRPTQPGPHDTGQLQLSRARALELKTNALDFFMANYDRSWAPAYLSDRLGTDLRHNPWFAVGYAPSGWTNLVDHLRLAGASDEEILGAGLGRVASTGTLIDAFRDRLMFPIYSTEGDLCGFIGRRNPASDLTDTGPGRHRPKYLNTSGTALFDKGAQLYGQFEGRSELAAGARPVLVEGPLDAIAVTIAAEGHYVGVAPLGTAFTNEQADALRPFIGPNRPGIIVATDADAAGRNAADQAFWRLAARGDAPDHLIMRAGSDPASILHDEGPAALRAHLAQTQPLARTLIDSRLDELSGSLSTAEGLVAATRAAAEVIGALPPSRWLDQIEYATSRLDPVPGAVHLAVADAGIAWTENLHRRAGSPLNPVSPLLVPDDNPTTDGRYAIKDDAKDESPEGRWHFVVARLDRRLVDSADWPSLATTLDRAMATGMNVEERLPKIFAAGGTLPDHRPALELRYRVIAEAGITPPIPVSGPSHPPSTPRSAVNADEGIQTDAPHI